MATVKTTICDTKTKRQCVLEEAIKCVCGERDIDYGTPENNFQKIASFWNIYLDGRNYITDVDVAIMLSLLKVARISTGGGTRDSFVDIAGYAACGGEIFENANE